MKIFKAYSQGFKAAGKSKKTALVIYLITFLFALTLALPFRGMLKQTAGNSMAINSMIKGFDFTTYTDFLRSACHAIEPFVSAVIWSGIFYLVFTIFFAGGVLKILNNGSRKFSAVAFFEGCAEYFFRYLRLAIYLIILQLIFAFIVFIPVSIIAAAAADTAQNEATIFYIVLTGIIVYLLFLVLGLTIGDYAKIILFINGSKKSLKSVWLAARFVIKHFFSTYFLYLILLIAPALLILVYFYLDNAVGMVSASTIFIMFIIQQIFVLARSWIKIWFTGSELSLYKMFPAMEVFPGERHAEHDAKLNNDSRELLQNPQTP